LGERGPANVEALSRRRRTGINIGTALGTDVKAVFRKLRDLSGAAGGIRRSRNAGEQRRSVIDNRLAYDELGWYPNMLLDDGLALTLAHFRDKVKSSGR
jgi:nucleoside-diphosphate-sugar epimerase